MINIKNISRELDYQKICDLLHFALDDEVKDVTINIIEYNSLLDRLSTPDLTINALTYPTNTEHVYSMVIRRKAEDIENLILHEAAHLMQFEEGRLKLNIQSGRCEWDGVTFSASFPYLARPWEKEAITKQHDLMAAWRHKNK